ncbi:hypothetical protein FDP41_012906 [Naegleria fowleri]|uniref:NmrA-like domain-containing protein n=1 Tax=Naegleria fowleri TaxID=5763 RepID=A0A6A5C5K0_NAEFO|nr:uncharacterized protein FDP41_012906 [Naegleria fowleri]KAF0981118.1 hypothetical protein FDP41_012906 [Naegleria fowleri]CAG4708371.1 unnamed protein product [Naegleria fowleri]
MATVSSYNYYTDVFIAGGTGNLGQHATRAFLKHPTKASVQILVRKESAEKAQELQELGAKLVFGDLATLSHQELCEMLKGVEVVVCILSGEARSLQLKLLKASVESGVKKFLPSSYGIDYNRLNYGVSAVLDSVKKVADEVIQSGLEYLKFSISLCLDVREQLLIVISLCLCNLGEYNPSQLFNKN